jgi:pimeloyl-ACP methyl ester carboxylesterase
LHRNSSVRYGRVSGRACPRARGIEGCTVHDEQRRPWPIGRKTKLCRAVAPCRHVFGSHLSRGRCGPGEGVTSVRRLLHGRAPSGGRRRRAVRGAGRSPPREWLQPERSASPAEAWRAIPIHVIAGRDDRFFPIEFQRRVARERLHAPVDELPGGLLLALANPRGLADQRLGYVRDGLTPDGLARIRRLGASRAPLGATGTGC